jgi:hypothetical protein
MSRKSSFVLAALVGAFLGHSPVVAQETGRLEVVVREGLQAVPCRIHLYDSANKTPKVAGWPAWNDHIGRGLRQDRRPRVPRVVVR